MRTDGADDLTVRARSALLDALDALVDHLDNVILVGAQAVYLYTGDAPVALAVSTKDSDLALDARALADEPRIDAAMRAAGFSLDPDKRQPGAWLSSEGIPVDLMVPDASSPGSSRGARIPPHSKMVARKAVGLEAAIVDHAHREIHALSADDDRIRVAKVAGPAALLIAKLHKVGERQSSPHRLRDKDAHDIYRLLVATDTDTLAGTMTALRADAFAGAVTHQALHYLRALFAVNDAPGSRMAGQAELGVGDPLAVAASVSALASDLLTAIG